MTGFRYVGDELVCDGVPLAEIAACVGTPVYVYSAATIRERYVQFDQAFRHCRHAVHYALKANSTLAIARLFRELGSGVDVNSGGELEVARRAGFEPAQIVFTGVGKTPEELEQAVVLDLKAINVESSGELDRIEALACRRGRRVRVALRVNPDVDARSHPYISTGLRTSKFGIPLADAPALCRRAASSRALALVGLHVHIGSQITTLDPIRQAVTAVADLAVALGRDGVQVEHIDVGGGLGISYDGSPVPDPAAYAALVVEALAPLGIEIVLEPGRVILGPAGLLVSRVVDIKPGVGRRWTLVLDAGMTELVRPALYGAFHRIELVRRRPAPAALLDIVGPLCESSDVLGVERSLPLPDVGDLAAIFDVGAYGAAMASNYNRRPLPAEVLVDGDRWWVVRRRQSIEDLLALEL